MKSKLSSMTTIETRPFWPYSYILWKEVYTNTRCKCIVLEANISERSSCTVRSSSFLNFSFLHQSFFTAFNDTALKHDRFSRALNGDTFLPPNRSINNTSELSEIDNPAPHITQSSSTSITNFIIPQTQVCQRCIIFQTLTQSSSTITINLIIIQT